MANRTYLYATDLVPSHDNAGALRRIVGLSECRYSTPLLYRILVCGEPQLCLSNIWHFRTEKSAPSHPLAVAAGFEQGLARLKTLRSQVVARPAATVLDEALGFLERPENRSDYFLLELAEFFDMFAEHEEPKGKLHQKIAAMYETLRGEPGESLLAIARDLNQIGQDDGQDSADTSMDAVYS